MADYCWRVLVGNVCVGFADLEDDPVARFNLIKEAVTQGLVPADYKMEDVNFQMVSKDQIRRM